METVSLALSRVKAILEDRRTSAEGHDCESVRDPTDGPTNPLLRGRLHEDGADQESADLDEEPGLLEDLSRGRRSSCRLVISHTTRPDPPSRGRQEVDAAFRRLELLEAPRIREHVPHLVDGLIPLEARAAHAFQEVHGRPREHDEHRPRVGAVRRVRRAGGPSDHRVDEDVVRLVREPHLIVEARDRGARRTGSTRTGRSVSRWISCA